MPNGNHCNGGPRASLRNVTDVTATIRTAGGDRSALVDDLSCTNIRLRGAGLPSVGQEIALELDPLSALGTVISASGDRCTVAFGFPLGALDVLVVKWASGLGHAARPGGRERWTGGLWQ